MKMDTHLVAAALAAGLTESAMTLTKTDGKMEALTGDAPATYAFSESSVHFPATSEGAGSLYGAPLGWNAGRRIGISVGSFFRSGGRTREGRFRHPVGADQLAL